MTKKIIIFLLALGAMHTQADQLEIHGFVITLSTQIQVVLSPEGEITNYILPSGKLKRDSDEKIETVGGESIKRDSDGNIRSVGGFNIKRDSDGEIESVGSITIRRDSDGNVTKVASAQIERNDDGEIDEIDGSALRVIFTVLSE